MIFAPKTVTLRDGRTAILRTPALSDAARMLEVIRTASGETEFLSRYPEEWDSMTLQNEENWIRTVRESPDRLVIACDLDGLIVGSIELICKTSLKCRHLADIGISILKDYWSLGIGTALFTELIAAAQARPGLLLLELDVMERNVRARRLYEKFGFREVACHPMAYRTKDGAFQARIHMQKLLEE